MIRKMNFFSDQEGIMTRFLREKENWDLHLQNTQRFIIDAFRDTELKNIAVLGSGWLLDLPLEYLSERFENVLLLDIHHPPQAKKKASRFNNVSFQEIDITGGGIEFVWELGKINPEECNSVLESFTPVLPELDLKPDAFISVNILNQLDILLVDYLKEKYSCFTEDHYTIFRKSIQQFHLDWISQNPGCLISDVEEENYKKNVLLTSYDLVHVDLPEYKRTDSWIWDFDLSGFYHHELQTKLKVQAIEW
jgi:hypothetical protein